MPFGTLSGKKIKLVAAQYMITLIIFHHGRALKKHQL